MYFSSHPCGKEILMNKTIPNDRPRYVGRTSKWSLGIDNYVIAIAVAALFFVIFVAAFIFCAVAPETVSKLLGLALNVVNVIKFVSLGLFVACFVVVFVLYLLAIGRISGHLETGRDGFANNARSLTMDRPNHNEMKFVYFKVYKDRISVTDFTGWREWVYLLAGIYQIRVRQTWFGKSFNYGDVILRSTGTAGEIEFPGIKDPHAFKAFLEKQISTSGVGVASILPQGLNAAIPDRSPINPNPEH